MDSLIFTRARRSRDLSACCEICMGTFCRACFVRRGGRARHGQFPRCGDCLNMLDDANVSAGLDPHMKWPLNERVDPDILALRGPLVLKYGGSIYEPQDDDE